MIYWASALLSMKRYSGLLRFSFKAARHCDIYQCDTQTTECQGDTFPECKCRPGLEKTEWDERSCSGKNLAALPNPERLTCLFPLSVPF